MSTNMSETNAGEEVNARSRTELERRAWNVATPAAYCAFKQCR